MSDPDTADKPVDEAVVRESNTSRSQHSCNSRSDDVGPYNACKAWYLFILHIAAFVLLFFSMIVWIDGHNFNTGSPSSLFQVDHGLFQTQVTGLVSLALVLLRLIAGSGGTLLTWRAIFILLEKQGLTLSELTRMSNHRLPFFHRQGSIVWSIWTIAVLLLLWVPAFAAPFASSSIAWLPSTKLSEPSPVTLGAVGQHADWARFLYNDARVLDVTTAASMSARHPDYAFNSALLPLRRYFDLDPGLPGNSTVNITLPYFDAEIRWIDAASDNRSQYVQNPSFSDITDKGYAIRNDEP